MRYLAGCMVISGATFLSGCAHHLVNEQRFLEVSKIIETVECELVAASRYFPNELNSSKTDDRWDIGTTLDLSLVSRLDGDGKVSWAIPLFYSASPSVGGYAQDSVTSHLVFATSLREANKRISSSCNVNDPDPSGTGMGLAAWIKTSFDAAKDNLGGISYTKILEFRADVGARFGYVLAPLNVDVGAGYHGTKTDQIVVGITPRGGPTNVVIVGDKRPISGSLQGRSRTGGGTALNAPAAITLSNPALQNLLIRQAPVRLLPGQTLR